MLNPDGTFKSSGLGFILRVVIVVSVICSLACSDARYVRWEYVVPDDYQGHLAIRFNCPGGEPLIRGGVARVRFKPDGTYCTSDPYVPTWESQWFPSLTGSPHRSASGKPIEMLYQPGERGYALCCEVTTSYGEDMFITMWVGDMERRETSPFSSDDVTSFLKQRFELRNGWSNP